ncbi:MAG: heme o synthase [Verrucomicrobiae bacterium]|nr:heme o synthase [Verrucomicrobiae bacterium]
MKSGAVTSVKQSLPFSVRLADYAELFKVRLTLLVLITTGVGFYLASAFTFDSFLFFHAIVGTALVAGGAAALNQVLEREWDKRMRRTQDRPLPAGRLSVQEACIVGLLISLVGIVYLAGWVNALASLLAGLTWAIYLFVYTPLKRKTLLNTLVGAIPGALPPVIGWAAVRNEISIEAVALFAIIFFWQIPHFLAIAWMYRDDYAAAEFQMLPVLDQDGNHTARQILGYTLALIPISLMPVVLNMAGGIYALFALIFDLAFLILAICFMKRRARQEAKYLFLASIFYLPLLLTVLVLDKR